MFETFLLTTLLSFFSAAGEVEITPITHGSLILTWNNKTIYVDPWSNGNYEGQPKADLILVTDIHGDHLDPQQISKVRKEDTLIVAPAAVQETVKEARVLGNGDDIEVLGTRIEAIPMYNQTRGPQPGTLFHTKGRGNGYVLTFGSERIYISGDTECIPEMKELKDIDVAFISMNLPYTMPPEEAAGCVNAFRPKVVIPYHYRGSDLEAFKGAVTAPGVEVRLMEWYP